MTGLSFYPRQGDTLPAPLEAGRGYYLLSVVSGTTYTISIDRGGCALDFTSSGSGHNLFLLVGLDADQVDGCHHRGVGDAGLNGLFTHLQQPARTVGLRIQAFPGPHGLLVSWEDSSRITSRP